MTTPQLIPTGTLPKPPTMAAASAGSTSFPSTTSPGTLTPAATGPSPQLIPTAGATNPAATPNTAIPGATTVPTSPNATVAPVAANETVKSQLDELLKNGSPYLDLARSQALQASSARGLQNSSIGAGAGESAAIEHGLPIAQQDASTYSARTAANLLATNQFGMTEAQKQATMAEDAARIAEQTGGSKELQAQQGQINTALQAQAEAANINQILTQGTVNEKLQASANAFTALQTQINNKQQIDLANTNFQNQLKLTMAQITANSALSAQNSEQQIKQINQTSTDTINQIAAQAAANRSLDGPALTSQYLSGVSSIMQATTQQIAQIYSTQGLSAAQQQAAVATANQQMQTNIANLQAYYSASPLWSSNFGAPSGGAPTPGTGRPGSPPLQQPVTTRPAPPPPGSAPPPGTPATPGGGYNPFGPGGGGAWGFH